MRLLSAVFATIILVPTIAFAQIGDAAGDISVFAKTCEKIINGESKSSARVRASDKASFKAVEEIPELREFRNYLDAHHFNLKVYQLVDNYLEDIKINVISQSDIEVCVEVSAYLPHSSIIEIFDTDASSSDDMVLDIEDDVVDNNVDITIPPKPEITINQEIAYAEPQDVDSPVIDNNSSSVQDETNKDRTIVFIDRTEFYNNTSTNGFFAHIERLLQENKQIKVVAKLNNPDYILKSKVLKARIDDINSQTGRLQIVVAIELIDTATSETVTEHQNRFVLFNKDDDAQVAAADLTKKLIAEGVAKILPQIKITSSVQMIGDSIITPR